MGGALGDAVGAAWEGVARLPKSGELCSGPLFFTDDTQLTWATCEAVLEVGGVEPQAIAARITAWFSARRLTGLGASTLKALRDLAAGGHWALSGATGEFAAGNGAAMRIAPLAFLLDASLDSHRQSLRDVCRITHRHDEAYAGALAVLHTIRLACSREAIDRSILCDVVDVLPDSHVRDRLAQVSRDRCSPQQFVQQYGATGYAADSIPLALLAATSTSDAHDLLHTVLACGGDTDTIAAFAMQCYAAAHGPKVLPRELLQRVQGISEFRALAEDFATFVVSR